MSDASKAQKLASARKKFKELKREKQQKQQNNDKSNILTSKSDVDNSPSTTPEPQNVLQQSIQQDAITFLKNDSQTELSHLEKQPLNEALQSPNLFFENTENFLKNEQNVEVALSENKLAESIENNVNNQQDLIENFNLNNEQFPKSLESDEQLPSSYFDNNHEGPKSLFEGSLERRVSFFDNFIINPENSSLEQVKNDEKNDDNVALNYENLDEMYSKNIEPQKTMQNLHEISNNIQKLIDPSLALSTSTSLEIKNQQLLQELEEQKRKNEELLKNINNQSNYGEEALEESRKLKQLLEEEKCKNEDLSIELSKLKIKDEENKILIDENKRLLELLEEEQRKPKENLVNGKSDENLIDENQRLLKLLEEQQRKNDEFYTIVQNQEKIISQLQSNEEMDRLQKELHTHTHTIQILIAEKNELAQNLNQIQDDIKQKQSDNEELQGRLRTSRSRVADLEREISALKMEIVNSRKNNEILNKLKVDYEKINDERNELIQDSLEIKEKLKNLTEENGNLKNQIDQLNNQLSLAHIKIQQLTSDGINVGDGAVAQEKQLLEQQIAGLNDQLKCALKDKEESNLHYQQYVEQLNQQIANLATRIQELEEENNSLKIQEQNRIKHIGQLEKILQDLQEQPQKQDHKKELDKALENLHNLSVEKLEMHENYTALLAEKDLLVKELEEKKVEMECMENMLEELKSGQIDNVKLLATMESDKVAAARAITQNNEMKRQMEGMQEVFMKLNEDKVQLTEQLDIEKRNCKELLEKLQKTELHLQTLAEAIEIKDKELSHLRGNSEELEKQMMQVEQLNDRLRHYEAQDNSSGALQIELQEAQQTIIKQQEEIKHIKSNRSEVNTNDETQQIIDKLQEEIRELKERNGGSETAQEAKEEDKNQNLLDKEAAMKQLEEKFLKTMKDIANLTEEKQNLEHLVLQLQGETETIGEYVALYQHQRSLLKQKAIEKDQQLQQLAQDREIIKNKLDKLKDLVEKLVEKGEIKKELINNQGDHIIINEEKIVKKNPEVAEIIDLLSEIKTSSLVQPTGELLHCPCCYGQLLTV